MAASKSMTVTAAPKLHTKGSLDRSALRGAVSFQDLNKRTTAVPSMRKGRSLARGGKR